MLDEQKPIPDTFNRKLEPWECGPKRIRDDVDFNFWNFNFSTNIGSPALKHKQDWERQKALCSKK